MGMWNRFSDNLGNNVGFHQGGEIHLENTSDEFKIKNINGYSDRFRNCEGDYNLYPVSFMLQWSKSS